MKTKGIFVDEDLHLALKLACHDDGVTMLEIVEGVVNRWIKGKTRNVPERQTEVNRTKNVWVSEELHHEFKRECLAARLPMTSVLDWLIRKWLKAREAKRATG